MLTNDNQSMILSINPESRGSFTNVSTFPQITGSYSIYTPQTFKMYILNKDRDNPPPIHIRCHADMYSLVVITKIPSSKMYLQLSGPTKIGRNSVAMYCCGRGSIVCQRVLMLSLHFNLSSVVDDNMVCIVPLLVPMSMSEPSGFELVQRRNAKPDAIIWNWVEMLDTLLLALCFSLRGSHCWHVASEFSNKSKSTYKL